MSSVYLDEKSFNDERLEWEIYDLKAKIWKIQFRIRQLRIEAKKRGIKIEKIYRWI